MKQFILLICFLALVIKYPLRKLGFHMANAFMMKFHEIASFGLFAVGIWQIIVSIKNLASLYPAAVISGIIAYAVDIIIIAACHMTKDPAKKLRDHRILSLLAVIASLIHIVICIFK